MIDISAASQLLDFGKRLKDKDEHRAREQLEGAVAIHNILEEHGVAYLADEVGMGKTYVALGALALFRHFNPDFRVLVIAPRENIQMKWKKEFSNFVANNLRFPDLRVASIERTPARPLVACETLLDFVRKVSIDPRGDFFLRLSSFSLALGNDSDRKGWGHIRDELRKEVPWLDEDLLDLRVNKETFKDNLARAICCALPPFDLVIVDEGHNLKRGFREGVAARNRVLALAFGHSSQKHQVSHFAGYCPKARRVLFLSATPLEKSYEQLWNQLDIFGHGQHFKALRDSAVNDEDKKRLTREFLIRRVTTIQAGGKNLTKNQYRREWRRGGFEIHDEPIRVEDDRQRLVIALVQKKVAELLGSEKFNMSFQIGMLASFESFLETARIKRADGEAETNFDDTEQTNDDRPDGEVLKLEREGIDVRDVNQLTKDYKSTFGKEMPHPKMDALVATLQHSWTTGEKALVFVRRIKSVDEIKRKLDEKYDEWLLDTLRKRLPREVLPEFGKQEQRYKEAKASATTGRQTPTADASETDPNSKDRGGNDTFFAWFFRGDGPKGIVSGANIQQRFIQKGSVYSIFFEQNYVMALLGAEPGNVMSALAACLGLKEGADLKSRINLEAQKYLGRAKKHQRGYRFEAAQAAAMEVLKNDRNIHQEYARIIWHERFQDSIKPASASEVPDVAGMLEEPTFFSELQSPKWADLREAIWPASTATTESDNTSQKIRDAFRKQELRAQILATAARLGHALIDLYILTVRRLGSIKQRTLDMEDDGSRGKGYRPITEYLELLEQQRTTPRIERNWSAFDELADVAENFDLILDVNAPEARNKSLAETANYIGALLRQQQPIGGMSGKINKTLVQQFRMPGYPLVMVTTDLLQEGEDLHTFCSAVYHYGIAWTPSSMEQRIGRVDRVQSKTDRRLNGRSEYPADSSLLQVYFPHLEDTVEVLQVRRVLERMNTFLRLMHEDLSTQITDDRRINVAREMVENLLPVERITETLKTAFPIQRGRLEGDIRGLKNSEEEVETLLSRFNRFAEANYAGLNIEWEKPIRNDQLLGTARLASGRTQPFALLLNTIEARPLVRCISPIGLVSMEIMTSGIAELARQRGTRMGAILGRDGISYNLTVEGDVLLGEPSYDVARVEILLDRVLSDADALEQIFKPGCDEAFRKFEKDLTEEGGQNHG